MTSTDGEFNIQKSMKLRNKTDQTNKMPRPMTSTKRNKKKRQNRKKCHQQEEEYEI